MSKVPAHPLDDFSLPSGGVILKSSDGVEFKVYKNILALASPFFLQMFTLPQPQPNESDDSDEPAKSTGTSSTSDVPVIDVPESSSTLNILLRLIYPVAPPSFPGISEGGEVTDAQALVSGIEPVLAAALKYDMHLIVKELCAKLLDAADTTLPDGRVVDDTLALQIFVLACRHGLKEEARRAAHASLKGRVAGVFIEDLIHISAAQYFHLIQFHRKIVSTVDSIIQIASPSVSYSDRLKCSSCDPPYNRTGFAAWWSDFVARAHPILHQSPRSATVFSTAFLENMFQKASRCTSLYCQQVPGMWHTISQYIKESIDRAIVENDIDLSEV